LAPLLQPDTVYVMNTESWLTSLEAGMPILYGGNQVSYVSEELAAAFAPGDRLIVVQSTGDLLHVPAAEHDIAALAVAGARRAFGAMGTIDDDQVTGFYEHFALRLEDDESFAPIAAANQADVERSRAAGWTTTRLELSEKMRTDMVTGLRIWREGAATASDVIETMSHRGWRVELVRAGLGVVGFVFEGRPNVFADATGLLRSRNTVVFRIGSAALTTARAIVEYALDPALASAGLPPGAVTLLDSRSRAAGWAMFADDRLALAVARGSGVAVSQLGAVARQVGTPVSLHGTGGAWIVGAESATDHDFAASVYHSLDRKVCNTLNTCCIVRSRAADLVPVFLAAMDRAADRLGVNAKLHVAESDMGVIPDSWRAIVPIARAEGPVDEPKAEPIADSDLGVEWEWEESPEATLKMVESVDEAVELFNTLSPRFAASLISALPDEHERFWQTIDAPFVGNGFTRWVDGQYALGRPELGLSNWQFGRLFGRGGVLSGDSVYTVRTRAVQDDPEIGR
jgi:glutamate-5-semialdehyde dehydrogenase